MWIISTKHINHEIFLTTASTAYSSANSRVASCSVWMVIYVNLSLVCSYVAVTVRRYRLDHQLAEKGTYVSDGVTTQHFQEETSTADGRTYKLKYNSG